MQSFAHILARLRLGFTSLSVSTLWLAISTWRQVVPYDEFKGKRGGDIDGGLLGRLGAGCLHDCALTLDIFQPSPRASHRRVPDHRQPRFGCSPTRAGGRYRHVGREEEEERRNRSCASWALRRSKGHRLQRDLTALLAAEGVEGRVQGGGKTVRSLRLRERTYSWGVARRCQS